MKTLEHYKTLLDLLLLTPSQRPTVQNLQQYGWIFKVAKQNRGWCRPATKTITIPRHALDTIGTSLAGYAIYYLAHEITHALVGTHHDHDAVFMERLLIQCPKEFIHHEARYKPRNAAAAGISKIPSIPSTQTPVDTFTNVLHTLDVKEYTRDYATDLFDL